MIGIQLASQASPCAAGFAQPFTPGGSLCMSSQRPGVTKLNFGSLAAFTARSKAPDVVPPSARSNRLQSPRTGSDE